MPLRERPHRYTMNVCTSTTATSGEANDAASTQRNAIEALRAGAIPATHSSSVPFGCRNGLAFTAPSPDGLNLMLPWGST